MTITSETVGRTLIVTIDRPERRNAIDQPTATALFETFTAFANDSALDIAILTGAGGTFCAGADLKAIATRDGNRLDEDMTAPGPLGCSRMELDKPVIAAVEGHAVAGGLELALWCDLRVASKDAVFGVYCRRWGVPLVDGGTVRLPRAIGHSRALDMILTGRAVDGTEAHDWGLSNRLCPPGNALAVATELAASISSFPPMCLRTDRRSAHDQWSLSMHDALANETRLGMQPIRAGETVAGAAQFAKGAGRHGQGV